MYFGKLALFLFMSLFQSLVTIIGSLILGIYIDNLPLFIISVILVSGVFMALIYSLNSALGNIGKGVAIILLLFQISGTKQISTSINGSFYSVDTGVDPDVILTRPESFYDRPALAEYLRTLK